MSEELVTVVTEGPLFDELQKAAQDSFDESEITEAFITDGNEIKTERELIHEIVRKGMRCFDSERIYREYPDSRKIFSKAIESGSNQSDSEIGSYPTNLGGVKVVEPPYPPELLAAFLEVDPVHFRCTKCKVTDAVGREYSLEGAYNDEEGDGISQEIVRKIAKETEEIKNFIENCNDVIGFEGVLERVCMDYEAIGWGAIEVIRSFDKKIRKIAHVPATRIKVLKGWEGFVEVTNGANFVYYQVFGRKLVSRNRKDLTTGKPLPYNPKDDGKISNGQWDLIDRYTGKPTTNFKESANEIIWIPKHHSATIYYGFSDVIPALGDLLANVHIRDYLLQFFEHNTVPRYAIIVKGAKLADPVKEAIMKYFSEHVKGKAHKTLIIPIPAMRNEVTVEFEKLGADVQEGSFQETRKNNQQGIMTAHGVSPAIIGINDAASLGSGKGLSQAEIYKDRIVMPSQRRFASALNRMFRLGLGVTSVRLKFNPLDIRDRQNEMQVYTGYARMGAMSINQMIKKAGLGEPIKGGDRPFIFTPKRGIVFVDELDHLTSDAPNSGGASLEEVSTNEKTDGLQPISEMGLTDIDNDF